MNEPQANRIKNILEINDKLPKDQQGRRSAIRRILGDGPWQHEPWSDKNLGLYLDVVHAWNCANNLSVAPEAGSLYESDDGLPLSRFERSVTDTIGWFRGVPMPSTGLSERIRRFLRWNPRTKNWKWIAAIARETQNSAEVLQRTLKTGTAEEQQDALRVHAERIAGCLVGVGVSPVPEFAWSIAEAGVALWDKIPQESVGIAKEIVRATPLAIASAKRMRIVNTITNLGYGIL
jgi:hypothetical protein